ncbi:HalOD1 output domain-containing protein [Haladaptatus sp. NG-SE-30]
MTETAPESVTKVCRNGRPSKTVIAAVAEAKGVDPLDMDPLYDVVDPDALNSMFRQSDEYPPTSMEIRFLMADCRVIIRDPGIVTVIPEANNERPTTDARDVM